MKNHRLPLWLAAVLLALSSLACGSATPAAAPRRAPRATVPPPSPRPAAVGTPTRPAATSTAAPTAGFASGGLGLSLADWERQHTASGSAAGLRDYDHGAYSLLVTDGNIRHLERNYRDRPVTLAQARQDAARLLPADSRLVRSYHPANMPELTVDLHQSAALRARFAGDVWAGGAPGDCIAIYNTATGKIARTVIATGNQP